MAVEPRRGCGYRKIGGLYLCSGGGGVPCDRLPIRLDVCPVCSHGFKQTRGWTWVDLFGLVGGNHEIQSTHTMNATATGSALVPCSCRQGMPMSVGSCPLCHDVKGVGKAGLLWIGEKFYKTTGDFMSEGHELGLSRRISAIPRNFKVGQTWVMLAHPKAISELKELPPEVPNTGWDQAALEARGVQTELVSIPGIFTLWRPARIEKILPESKRNSDEAKQLLEQGITPVFVPDNDPDHQGTVYDKSEEEETAEVVEKSA